MFQLLQLGIGTGVGPQQLSFPICLGQGDGGVLTLAVSQSHVWFLGSLIAYMLNSLYHDLVFFLFCFFSIDSGLSQIELRIIYKALMFL